MKTVKRNYRIISEGDKSWAAVKMTDILKLGVTERMTNKSLIDFKTAYIETERDFPILLAAGEAAGWEITTYQGLSTDKDLYVRRMTPYRRYWVRNPLKLGSKVCVDKRENMKVVHISKRLIVLSSNETGSNCVIARFNPYARLSPPITGKLLWDRAKRKKLSDERIVIREEKKLKKVAEKERTKELKRARKLSEADPQWDKKNKNKPTK